MPDVIGIDHLYLTVSNMEKAEAFYDIVMAELGFRKQAFELEGEPHIQYYNRHFGYVLRPARSNGPHDPYAPGLHHLCLRVENENDVRTAAQNLAARHIAVSEPKRYPQYAADYWAVFLTDPDGIQLEISNYRQERRQRHDHWQETET